MRPQGKAVKYVHIDADGALRFYAGNDIKRLIAFAIDCARSDLECHCPWLPGKAQRRDWYDLTACLPGGDVHEFMAEALWILRNHDQLITHPTKPHLVRLKPAAPTTTGDTPNG